jgi:hypothetical protein
MSGSPLFFFLRYIVESQRRARVPDAEVRRVGIRNLRTENAELAAEITFKRA